MDSRELSEPARLLISGDVIGKAGGEKDSLGLDCNVFKIE
jgi:hypothetical protein